MEKKESLKHLKKKLHEWIIYFIVFSILFPLCFFYASLSQMLLAKLFLGTSGGISLFLCIIAAGTIWENFKKLKEGDFIEIA